MTTINKYISAALCGAVIASCTVCPALGAAYTADEANVVHTQILGTDNATVTIDESNIIQPMNCELFGMGIVTNSALDDLAMSGSTELSSDVKQLMKDYYTLPAVRFGTAGGAFANIAQPAQRKSTNYNTSYNGLPSVRNYEPVAFGPIEVIKMVTFNNPDAVMTVCVSIDDEPETLANLARFLTDEADESSWGAMRVQYGLPAKPLNVIFELGNERDDAPSWKFSQKQMEWYIDTCVPIVKAVREACPEVRIAACGKTAMWGDPEGTVTWTRGLSEAMGNDIDYVVMHPYYSGYEMPTINYYIDTVYSNMNQGLKDGHEVKVLITEHAKWPSAGTEVGGDMLTLESVLATSNFYNQVATNTKVYGAHYHTFYSQGDRMWGTVKNIDNSENKMVKQGAIKMFKLYTENVGDRVLGVDITGDSDRMDISKSSGKFSVLATAKDKRTLTLFLTNRSQDYDINVDFKFGNKYKLTREQILTAPNRNTWAYNNDAYDLFTVADNAKNESGFTNYKMPAKSLVVLTLEASSNLPQIGGSDSAGGDDISDGADIETDFADLNGVWARNEIAKMKELGFVNGVSDTAFEPMSNITRAQFAAILARACGFAADYPSVFADVDSAQWYAPYANAMYFEGAMTGDENGMFNPNEYITLEEAVCTVQRIYSARNNREYTNNDAAAANFKDLSGISDWARESILHAAQNGLLTRLYENGNLNVSENATRAEAVSLIYRLYNSN